VPPVVTDAAPQQPVPEAVAAEPVPSVRPVDRAPEQAAASGLPKPQKVSQETEAGESEMARVSAGLSVELPEAVPAPDPDPVVLAQTISAVSDAAALPNLPAPAREESGIAPQAAVPAAPPAPAATPAEPASEEPAPQVRVNRLPTLGAETEAPAAEDVPEEAVQAPEEPSDAMPVPPIDRFGATFESEEGKPLMAVLLMDDGADLSAPEIGIDALRALPYPVSFAVDALLPDAADRMAAYRDAGFEVLAMVDLPEGALAEDAEVNLSVALDTLPEVVGVLDGVRTGIQTTPDAGRQVARILSQSGHGLVTQNRGLNTVQKLALRDGVPAAVVFRDFDAKDQSGRAIGRFFDQAAFRAAQEGGVIMLGRLRAETIAALVVWALQDRSASVAMAPVSAVLKRQLN
jgi:polysaccharide deacetylase 2 family uncharacterized protein YibQ